ncbi:protein kinase [Spongiactinospora sp. TRM90649]|uniref:serine/threonine-protein kinase n=1 Tax=Spongiactinospora sp. TRM90649 TaxID=3031114 RepID=UPI0023F74D89|nr:protein kinase [Spongiactinospora sp. TRM90649]MDF5757499.1 protein kinase [Spongiactinospora sp. TRM90649]
MSRPVPPTVPDPPPPPPTVADEPGGLATEPLPPALAGRFGPPRPFAESGEARLYLAEERGGDGRTVVIKVYRSRSKDRAEVYAALREITSPYVVKPIEAAPDEDPPYEVSEYLSGGSLRDLMAEYGGRLPYPLIRVVVEQCARALAELHAGGVKHRDIKPDNILVHERDPLVIGLTDFGIARGGAAEAAARADRPGAVRRTMSGAGTLCYMSPQAVARLVSTDDDYWSFGVTIAELALGHHPLPVGDAAYSAHVIAHPIDVSAVEPADLRLLCQGLLRRDPDRRWRHRQVRAWLDGDPPPVEPETTEEAVPGAPPFGGVAYGTPRDLAVALSRDWTAGITWAEANWRALPAWLDRFPHIDQTPLRRHHDSLDVRQLHLIRALSPGSPPRYLAVLVTPESLPAIARRAADHFGVPTRLVGDLWRYRLLKVLDQAEGGAGLAGFDDAWRDHGRRWREVAATLRAAGAPMNELDHPVVLAELLLLACARGRAAELRRTVAATRRTLAEMRVSPPWFDAIAAADDDEVSLLAAALLGPAAIDYALERHEVWRQYLDARRRAALREWLDRTQRSTALGWAALAVAVPAVLWVVALTVSDLIDIAPAAVVGHSWLWAALCVLIMAVTEIPFAAWLGRRYHPRHSLAATMITAGGRAVRPLRGRRWLSLLVIVVVAGLLGLALSLLPVVLPVAAIVAHLVWLVLRARRWRARPESPDPAGLTAVEHVRSGS